MSRLSGKWADLLPRTLSAFVMAAVGVGATHMGGWVFALLILLCLVAMLWELHRMMAPALRAGRDWPLFLTYGAMVVAASLVFIMLRLSEAGIWAVACLFSIVVMSDVLGYFAGRLLGGPKFWPRISPKKTWSGTVAGWLGAGGLGLYLSLLTTPPELLIIRPTLGATVFVFMVLALASQLGDIAESALKRRNNIKDSSNLIPGHGGFLDRFDGMVGVGSIVAVLWLFQALFGL
jgi:phosphatidate cytidylyltransferase